MTPTDINESLTAIQGAGLYGWYETGTDTVYAVMEYPDPQTDDVYTEEVPCHSLKEVYDLLGQ